MISPKPVLLVTLALLSGAAAAGQSIGPSAIDAAGSSVTTGGNTYEYAIGQTVVGNTATLSSLIITPGVLQPNVNPNGVEHTTIRISDLQVFPSPAEHTVFLQPAFNTGGKLQWSLYSVDGHLVRNGTITLRNGNERQEIDISALAVADYSLQISWLQAGIQYASGYKIQKLR